MNQIIPRDAILATWVTNAKVTSDKKCWLSTVAHTYNPGILASQGGQITRGQEWGTSTSLANVTEPDLCQNAKISQAWWHTPIITATQEAEAGEWLESRRLRLL